MASVTAVQVFAAIGAAAAVAGTVQQRKAGKEQERQNEVQNRIAASKRIRNIRRTIAVARVRRAEVQATGFELGVSGGTAVSGAVAGITSDLAGNIGAANQQFTGQQVLADSANRVSSLNQSAANFGSVSNLAGQFDSQTIAAIQGLT